MKRAIGPEPLCASGLSRSNANVWTDTSYGIPKFSDRVTSDMRRFPGLRGGNTWSMLNSAWRHHRLSLFADQHWPRPPGSPNHPRIREFWSSTEANPITGSAGTAPVYCCGRVGWPDLSVLPGIINRASKDLEAVTPAVLGSVERDVGVLHQCFAVDLAAESRLDSNANRNRHLHTGISDRA